MTELDTSQSNVYSAWPKHEFFAIKHSQAVDMTYNDLRVATGPSEFDEDEIDLSSRFSRNVDLKVPFVSAAMDTVTEHKMAIVMAKLGGLGVIHANLSDEQQKEEVRSVKHELYARIPVPISFNHERTLDSILGECDKEGYDFRTFPITDNNNLVLGMLTGSIFKYKRRVLGDVTAEQAMIPLGQLTSGGPDMTVEEAYTVMEDREVGTVPLLNPDGTSAGMYLWSDVERIVTGDDAMYNLDAQGRLRTAIAVSTHESSIERVRKVMGDGSYLDVVVVDTSKGDGKHAVPILKLLKQEFPNLDVVVGNVSEPEGALKLAMAGADGIKVGQGPGSICTTRLEIGIGCPQATAVYNCAEAVRGMDVPICADGGIQYYGDLHVAVAVGGDSIMMGGMFAATEESPGVSYRNAKGMQVKGYRGMGSEDVIRESRDVRGYGKLGTIILPEGVVKELPFKGLVEPVFRKADIALRRGIATTGKSPTLAGYSDNARFRFHTDAGIQEGKPHEVYDVN